jgi:hypothetical protein
MRVLVIYYQHSSACADLALSLAEHLDADIEVVSEERELPTALGVLQTFADVVRDRAEPAPPRGKTHYDIVVVTATGWEVTTSARMLVALRSVSHGAGATAFVHVGRPMSAGRILRRMQRTVGRSPVAVLTLDPNELESQASMRKTLEFADDVRVIAERLVDRRRRGVVIAKIGLAI